MEIKMNGNMAQLPGFILQPKCHVSVEGRGTGKSADIGFWLDRLIRLMPKAVIALTGKTFGQLLTRTLPSSLKILNQLGYQKDQNYVIGKRPPAYFDSSYEEINKFDNFVSVSNGVRIALISQSEPGSGRGSNVDFEIADETLTLNKEQYDQEVVPTNRGNLEFFGSKSQNPIHLHHGFKYSTSMPPTRDGRWVLEFADYYEREAGIRLFETWNRVVKMQLELLDIDNPKQFAEMWNEIARVKSRITPFVSSDGLLFTVSNAFDNIEHLGLSYIKKSRQTLPPIIFLCEIMNYLLDKVEDCFYSIIDAKHVYHNGLDDKNILEYAKNTNFDIDRLQIKNSLFDRDCNADLPIEIVPDWGSSISLFCVCQQRNYDFVGDRITGQTCQNFINEFFVKPDENSNVLIKELCGQFTEYYKHHNNKTLHYYRDRYGDSRNPNIINSMSYNQLAISYFRQAGWEVREFVHKGMEPPQSDKYLLWGLVLREERDDLPLVRFNGEKCRHTLISMNNARIKDVDGQLKKDKSSERKSSGILQEEATHFSDAADKILWSKFGKDIQKKRGGFIPVRISK
ncbi:hypothetical protein LJC68_10055 [Bacteroidales bacterium OttesenSCG-928-B11]|nr:hypothetical protein [Bacteroidales bacterium OttesenSCG-928-C03]MDL2313203.1 hypothetical protein [Bacteroidales bacterium OttesenSCG-928-B11]MDL2326127.1 hypothetical protein [Bacteroidales bacterium OttesenSCG-928-A14]